MPILLRLPSFGRPLLRPLLRRLEPPVSVLAVGAGPKGTGSSAGAYVRLAQLALAHICASATFATFAGAPSSRRRAGRKDTPGTGGGPAPGAAQGSLITAVDLAKKMLFWIIQT